MAKKNQKKDELLPYHIKFNDEQKEALNSISKNRITILSGAAGTGKTLLAVYSALKYLSEEKVERIIITRPAVTTEDFGFLPGDLQEKYTNVYLLPIIDFINKFGFINQKSFQTLLDEKKIIPLPLAYMRGVTADNAFIILDESENVTEKQMLMVLTRIGKGSTMVVSGDIKQCDLNIKRDKSGLEKVIKLSTQDKCKDFIKHLELTKIERDEIVGVILNEWEKI